MRLSTPKLISFNSNNTYIISRESTTTNYSNLNNITLPIQKTQNLNFKIVLIGDISVGKTSILNRFFKNTFSENYQSNINANFISFSIFLDKFIKVNLNIWDTCGEEKFKSITKQYYRDASAILLVYDLTKENSLKSIENWLNEIKTTTNESEIFLVGNKNDDEKLFPIKNKENFTEFVNSFYEVSAKTGNNIQKMFYNIIEILAEKSLKEKNFKNINNESLLLDKNKFSKKKKCC
jgi:small GTP-binding protein